MPPDSLWIKLPEIIGIPLALLFVLAYLRGTSAKQKPGKESAVDLGMDFAVLAAGTTGSIFASDRISQVWGAQAVAVYGILVVCACIVFMAWLAHRRRWQPKVVTGGRAFWDLALGVIPLLVVTAILVLGYTYTPRR
jgi:hypothetical protein